MKFKKPLAIAIGCVAIAAALIIVDELKPQPISLEVEAPMLAPVSVVDIIPSPHESSLSLLALTTARWPLKLKASSNAQVSWLNPEIEPGLLVKKGTELARLDTSALDSVVSLSLSELQQAELNLQKALHEQTVALKMLNPNKSSAFARREPQVKAAKAEVNRAKQAHRSALKQLDESHITAPFDAVIIRRHISPGEWVEAGQATFDLAASDSLDIKLPVSEQHWQKVQAALVKPKVVVESRSGHQWPANVRYLSPQVDKSTRQRQVVLSVKNPYKNKPLLLPNQQVKVIVHLGSQPEVVTVPLSAMTRDGYVWTIDSQNRLQKEVVRLVGQTDDDLYLQFLANSAASRRVVLYPLSSMLPGTEIEPQLAGADFIDSDDSSLSASLENYANEEVTQ